MIEIRERGMLPIVKNFFAAKLGIKRVAVEEMETLADDLVLALKQSIAGARTTGTLEDSIEWQREGLNKIVISDSAPYSEAFVYGTTGPYKGIPFDPIKAWAKEKGIGMSVAGAIAVSISKAGTMNWGGMKPSVYPQYGSGTGFDFYSYVKEVVMRDRIAETGNAIVEHVLRESHL